MIHTVAIDHLSHLPVPVYYILLVYGSDHHAASVGLRPPNPLAGLRPWTPLGVFHPDPLCASPKNP